MERSARFDFGEKFARLTAHFEDAAELAVLGQSAQMTDKEFRVTTKALGDTAKKAQRVLEEIDFEL